VKLLPILGVIFELLASMTGLEWSDNLDLVIGAPVAKAFTVPPILIGFFFDEVFS
jgi:hypothetical protein